MHGNDAKPSRIYSYGAKAPTINGEAVRQQIYDANRYRNNLVAAERERREASLAALRRYFPEVETLEQRLAEATEALEAAIRETKAKNAKARKRVTTDADKDRIKSLRAARKRLTITLKEAKARCWGNDDRVKELHDWYKAEVKRQGKKRLVLAALRQEYRRRRRLLSEKPEFQDEINRVEDEHDAKLKELRAACRVFWGTYLTVEQSLKGIREGKPPRFKRFRGDGKIAVQFQGGLSVADAFAGMDTRFRLRPKPLGEGEKPSKAAVRRYLASVRIGSDGRAPIWAEFVVTLHRDLPPDAQIKWSYGLKRRIGTHDEWALQLVISREDGFTKEDQAESGYVAVDVGWRLRPNGLRVAYWIGSDGAEGELILPHADLKRWEKHDDLQQIRDRTFNVYHATLVTWLKAEDLPIADLARELQHLRKSAAEQEWKLQRLPKLKDVSQNRRAKMEKSAIRWRNDLEERCAAIETLLANRKRGVDVPKWLEEETATLASWRSEDRLAKLVLKWRFRRFTGDQSIFPVLEWWRKQDKHLYDWQAFVLKGAIRWRDDVYRNLAAILRRRYHAVITEDVNWRDLQDTPEVDQVEGYIPLDYRRCAAVGRLVQLCCENAGEAPKAPASQTTTKCATTEVVDEDMDKAQLEHCYSGSQEVRDQDRNACLNMLRWYRERGDGERAGSVAL